MTLHTKYRPSELSGIAGQDHIKSSLAAVLNDDSARSFLFEGPSGCGKTTLARICAKEKNCTDIMEVDAASNTGVDDMRAISERASYRVLDGGNRAFIIDECHRLSKQAWESLLKHIEEPPPGTYWLFCTTEGGRVMPTIRTRCAAYTLKSVPYRALMALVTSVVEAESMELSGDIVDVAVSEARGSPRQALVNLALIRNSESVADAKEALNRAPASLSAIDVARMLTKEWTLGAAVKALDSIGDESPESVRMTIFHYHLKVALGGNLRSLIVLDEFEKPADERHKMGDILLRLARIKKRMA